MSNCHMTNITVCNTPGDKRVTCNYYYRHNNSLCFDQFIGQSYNAYYLEIQANVATGVHYYRDDLFDPASVCFARPL